MELIKLQTSSAEIYKFKWGSGNTRKSKSPLFSIKPAALENFNIVTKQDKFRCGFYQ